MFKPQFTVKQKELGWILAEEGRKGTPFLDIDGYTLKQVKKEIRVIQRKEKWGDATILKSSKDHHWHVYFAQNLEEWGKIIKVIDKCPIVDKKFKQFKEDYPFIRARVSRLPRQKLIIVESKYSKLNNSFIDNFLRYVVS